MAKTTLMPRLKNGRTVIGKLVEVEDERIILESQKGQRITLPMVSAFAQAIDLATAEEPILEISMVDGEYKIAEYDVWPDEKSE